MIYIGNYTYINPTYISHIERIHGINLKLEITMNNGKIFNVYDDAITTTKLLKTLKKK